MKGRFRAVGMFPPGVGAERRRYCTHVDSSMGGGHPYEPNIRYPREQLLR